MKVALATLYYWMILTNELSFIIKSYVLFFITVVVLNASSLNASKSQGISAGVTDGINKLYEACMEVYI